MSPVTHGMIGWLVAQPLKHRRDRVAVTVAALIPDIDGMGVLISLDYYSLYHHTFGHSVLMGLALSILSWMFARQRLMASTLVFVSFNSHMLGDLLGSGAGWGIPYFWPFLGQIYEFQPPFRWELDSWQNFLATVICMIAIIRIGVVKQRTIAEVVSVQLDQKIVRVFRNWFVEKKFGVKDGEN